MAKFYGMIQGNRGAATRCGSTSISASVQSWNGSVITQLSYDKDDNLMISVNYSTGSSAYGTSIFYGTVEEFVNKLRA
jgi:hypothetical protein